MTLQTEESKDELIGKMRAVLVQCYDQFRFYEQEHIRKGSFEKSATNAKFAIMCSEVLK
jgi:hypothetical protein